MLCSLKGQSPMWENSFFSPNQLEKRLESVITAVCENKETITTRTVFKKKTTLNGIFKKIEDTIQF